MELRERIVEKAESLFWQYGIRSITMDDIAREIGISKKTIYQHFIDKDDIVYQVILNRVDQDAKNSKCRIADAKNPIEGLLFASEMFRKLIGEMNPALLIDMRRHHPRAWEVCMTYREKHILEGIKTNLKEGIEQGLYRSDIDIDILARLRLESVQWGFNSNLFSGDHSALIEVQLHLLHHFIRGILSPKGFTIYNKSCQIS